MDTAAAKKRCEAATARVAYWESQWRASVSGSEKEAWYEAIVMDLHDAAGGFAAALEALGEARGVLADLEQVIRVHIVEVDELMKGPATRERGMALAGMMGHLEAAILRGSKEGE